MPQILLGGKQLTLECNRGVSCRSPRRRTISSSPACSTKLPSAWCCLCPPSWCQCAVGWLSGCKRRWCWSKVLSWDKIKMLLFICNRHRGINVNKMCVQFDCSRNADMYGDGLHCLGAYHIVRRGGRTHRLVHRTLKVLWSATVTFATIMTTTTTNLVKRGRERARERKRAKEDN